MSKTLTKKKREAIIAAIKVKEPLIKVNDLMAAIKYSDENPKTKPHFLVHSTEGHVIIY